jgi:hypothetical protein
MVPVDDKREPGATDDQSERWAGFYTAEMRQPFDERISLELCEDSTFFLHREMYLYGDETWEEWQGKTRRTEGSELRMETETYTSGDRGSFGLNQPPYSEPSAAIFLLKRIGNTAFVLHFEREIIQLERVSKRI